MADDSYRAPDDEADEAASTDDGVGRAVFGRDPGAGDRRSLSDDLPVGSLTGSGAEGSYSRPITLEDIQMAVERAEQDYEEQLRYNTAQARGFLDSIPAALHGDEFILRVYGAISAGAVFHPADAKAIQVIIDEKIAALPPPPIDHAYGAFQFSGQTWSENSGLWSPSKDS